MWGGVLENTAVSSDTGYEVKRIVDQAQGDQAIYPGHRWQFITLFWDTAQPRGAGRDVDLTIRSVLQEVLGTGSYDSYVDDLQTGQSEDIADPATRFILGGCLHVFSGAVSPENAVMDEFAILDFGADGLVAKGWSDAHSLLRYQDGRYYKGEDGRFLSPPVAPDPGNPVRLLWARWTAYLPREDRLEIREGFMGTLPPAGTPRPIDSRLDGASVGVSLSLPGGGTLPLSQGAAPAIGAQASFRYEVAFRTGIKALDVPALESPFLDDITFAWQAVSGPRILGWERP
jgi:hypothetical protein